MPTTILRPAADNYIDTAYWNSNDPGVDYYPALGENGGGIVLGDGNTFSLAGAAYFATDGAAIPTGAYITRVTLTAQAQAAASSYEGYDWLEQAEDAQLELLLNGEPLAAEIIPLDTLTTVTATLTPADWRWGAEYTLDSLELGLYGAAPSGLVDFCGPEGPGTLPDGVPDLQLGGTLTVTRLVAEIEYSAQAASATPGIAHITYTPVMAL